MVVKVTDVSVNVAESELVPSFAVIFSGPVVETGTSKSVSKCPILLVWLDASTTAPKVMITLEFGLQPVSVTCTDVPIGPDVGLSSMLTLPAPRTVAVNSQLQEEPTTSEFLQSIWLPFIS